MATIRRVLAYVVLVALGLIGLNNATSWPGAQTAAQRLAVVVAVAAGLVSLACAIALWRQAAGLRRLLIACVIGSAAAAGMATWAWSTAPAQAWIASLAGGAAVGGIAAALAWPRRLRREVT